MRIIFFSFLLLFIFSTKVMSCPSSGDGDCVPSTKTYTKQIPNNDKKQESSLNASLRNEASGNNSESYESNNSDPGLPDDYIPKKTAYIKEINKKSNLNSEIQKLNFQLDKINYRSLKKYNSNFSNDINNKFIEVNRLIIQNKNIDRDIFNSLYENIDKIINTILDTFDNDKTLKLYPHKKNNSNLIIQINKYNEINDIIKTLEVMN
ncbi:hypothetical protein OA253_01115 [Alphaproteobacteria bacterium]|nr:hypothetical protein [Alphaproteobacteria bacterium]